MMDALFRLPNNDLSAALQKDKLFKEVEQQWNTVSSEEGNSRRKVDYEIYKSIVYNLEVRKVFLDPKLSLVKFSSIVILLLQPARILPTCQMSSIITLNATISTY